MPGRSSFKWIAIGGAALLLAAAAWWYPDYRARHALLAQPVYRVLQKHQPEFFDLLLERYRRYLRGSISHQDFVNFANARISAAATRSLAHASPDAALALVADMLATARKLQANSADACFRFWFPEVEGAPEVATLLDADAQAHTLALMGEVIRTAAETPAPLPENAEVSESLSEIINGIFAEFGADAQMLAHARVPRVDRARVCTITIALYQRIMSLPPARASAVIRSMTQTS